MKKKCLAIVLIFALCLPLSVPAFAATFYDYTNAGTPICNHTKAYLNNLQLAIDAIDGYTLYPGETFSFNKVIGPRDQKHGYLIATNGRGSRVRGGGVSQLATTLNQAVMNFGCFTVEDYSTYGDKFVGGYVKNGDQAVVTDYSRGDDYVITSNYPKEVTISAWIEEDWVYCGIEGDAGLFGSYDEYDDYDAYDDDDYYNLGVIIGVDSTRLPRDKSQRSNIERSYMAINGTWLYYGDVFSFNDIVGPRTKQTGYVTALNGRGSKVVGGGVAQVASTVYLAAKYVDCITIDRVSTYGDRFTGGYVDDPADAIVTDYNAGTDLSFTYYGDGSLQIVLHEEDGWLYCELIEY